MEGYTASSLLPVNELSYVVRCGLWILSSWFVFLPFVWLRIFHQQRDWLVWNFALCYLNVSNACFRILWAFPHGRSNARTKNGQGIGKFLTPQTSISSTWLRLSQKQVHRSISCQSELNIGIKAAFQKCSCPKNPKPSISNQQCTEVLWGE